MSNGSMQNQTVTTSLFLIRHGETNSNVEKRYSGFLDDLLNDNGRLQAQKLHEKLKNNTFDQIYASDRIRAIETASIVFKNSNIISMPELKEINFGVFEGLNHNQIKEKYLKLYEEWINDPYNFSIPEGETVMQFKSRILNGINKILKLHNGQTIAVVTHGGVISVLMNYFLNRLDFWKFIPGSTGVSLIVFKDNQSNMKFFNDTSHLS